MAASMCEFIAPLSKWLNESICMDAGRRTKVPRLLNPSPNATLKRSGRQETASAPAVRAFPGLDLFKTPRAARRGVIKQVV
jgi:hypothetical protein